MKTFSTMKYAVRYVEADRLPWSVWASPARLVGSFSLQADAEAFVAGLSAPPAFKPLSPSVFKLRLLRLRPDV